MSNNYVLLEKIVVGAAGASSVTFSGIPQTGYTDLVVKMSTRTTENPGASALGIQFNGASTTVSAIRLSGTGSGTPGSGTFAASSGGFGRYNNVTGQAADTTASTFSNGELYFPNYTSSNFKSFSNDMVTENNGTTAYAEFDAGLWSSTSAITSIGINVYGGGGSFVQGSTFYLYGVAKLGTTPAIVPYATGGDTIMTDGDYWYHAFLSSGTFAPITNLSCDVLVVAGGGGGGGGGQYYPGGGAGAGGVLAHPNQSLVATNYTVTVGAGGAGSNSSGSILGGSQGSNSQFASLTASVGGGSGNLVSLGYGGSGGSAGSGALGGTGTATVGQGNLAGTPNGFNSAGGGGGAGGTGFNATSNANGGAGGAGVNTYTGWGSLLAALTATGTGVSGYIAGGGGGGGSAAYGTVTQALGGSGGGGNGGTLGSTGVTSGTANTGGGGGGGAGTNASAPPYGVSGLGGSGLVIVRYPV